MRDLDQLKDKTVLALDSRQLFFVFFGGSVAAALLFALGILVGRKLPSQEADIEEDPLAMLDQLGAEEEALSFQKGLKGRAQTPAPVGAPTVASAVVPREPEDAVLPPVKPAATEGPAAPVSKPSPRPASPAKLPAAVPPEPSRSPPPVGKPERAKRSHAAVPETKPVAPETVPADESSAAPGRFTLQLSSFQEKGEAAEFMDALGKKGYETYLVSAEVPGRGQWYRVRLGDYPTHDDALVAKADFERKQRIIAYVLRK